MVDQHHGMIQWKRKVVTNQVAELDPAGKFLDLFGGYDLCWHRKRYVDCVYTQTMTGLRCGDDRTAGSSQSLVDPATGVHVKCTAVTSLLSGSIPISA